jgi:beta-lactamase regulating signal transducer with metallopeptidase domain
MGKPRLGGWTRVGIIASVLWVLGDGGAMFYYQSADARYAYRQSLSKCAAYTNDSDAVCKARADEKRQRILSGRYSVIAFAVFTHLLFFWLIAWVIRAIYRWVRRGFGVPPSPQS